MDSLLDEGIEDFAKLGLKAMPLRKITPHFIHDKRRDYFRDKQASSICSHSRDEGLLKKSSFGKIHKNGDTLISFQKPRSIKMEEYSTQAYDIRSMNINSKLSCVLKRGSMAQVEGSISKMRLPSFVERLRKMSSAAEIDNETSLLHCINNPSQIVFCEKFASSHVNEDQIKIATKDTHTHSQVKSVKGSFIFKNRFHLRSNSSYVPGVSI